MGYVEARVAAAWALAKIKDPRAVEALTLALKDRDEDVRRLAAKALENIGAPRAAEEVDEPHAWTRDLETTEHPPTSDDTLKDIPRRPTTDLDNLLGDIVEQGAEGRIYQLAGDPTKVIKVYNAGEFGVRQQIQGLEHWDRGIKAAGLQDEIEAVRTLEWGRDAQGRAFTIHPRISGEVGPPFADPAHNKK